MNRFVPAVAFAFFVLATAAPLSASVPVRPRPTSRPDPFAEQTRGFTRREGLLATWVEPRSGKLMLELPPPVNARGDCGTFLYLEGIRTGLGSNPVGLDRGQNGEARVVTFRRVGSKVLLEQPNLRYRAQSSDSNEVRAVRESFASSVLWAGEVTLDPFDGRQLVDFTSFIVRDAHNAAATIKAAGQGSFSVDKDRSTLDPAGCKSFPDNLEFEAVLTFAGDEPGREVRETAPTPRAITIVQHQSLVRLPDSGYRPRAWDPRSGSFDVMFADYAQPIGAPIDVHWLVRFRLEKTDPAAARSRVKKPIVYYVDSAAPEPIRSALVEGASWWARAFEAAGFIDAFQVKVLPPDADPLDVRYNVVEWVHRATRGWSYGGGVTDPRTGEMIQGRVTLGSLRIRQDRMIFEGLADATRTGRGGADDPIELGLARIRQLAAHEVGHTLGFSHNFAASTYAGRASVMDYPAPLVGVTAGGTLDFSRAYATGAGVWDVQQVRYAYSEYASAADEQAGLAAILRENRERHYLYMSDPDTRPAGAAHPLAAMWDNGADPAAELAHEMDVRRIALAKFGEKNVAPGTPLARLNEVLVPVYFHHRYALEAAAKSVGGLDYTYAVAGSSDPRPQPVVAARQRAALDAVIATLDPVALDLPEPLLALLAPPVTDEPPHHEAFGSNTTPAFDALGAAASAADLTLATLLVPERLARCVDFHRRDSELPGVEEVLGAITRGIFNAPAPTRARLREVRRAVQAAAVRRLLMAAAAPNQTAAVRAALEATLADLRGMLQRAGGDAADRARGALLARDIGRWLDRGTALAGTTSLAAPSDLPPGPPIGAWSRDDDCEWSAAPR